MTRRIPFLLTCPLLLLATGCVLVVESGPDRPADYHYRSGDVVRRFEVWADGPIAFTPNDAAVASIGPGGFLYIEERRAFRTRRVRVEPTGAGRLEITHTVNGRDQGDGADSREALAAVFGRVARQTTIGVEARVARLLSAGGANAVLDAVEQVDGSRVVSRYLRELLGQTRLSHADLRRVAALADQRIPSSGARAAFLIDAWPSYAAQEPALDGYFEAVGGIPSGASRARVLAELLEDDLTPALLRQVLAAAAEVPSAGATARVLVLAVPHYVPDAPVREAFFEAVDAVPSGGERARVLMTLIGAGAPDVATLASLLRSAARIPGNESKTQVLVAATRHYRNDPAIRDAFFPAVRAIASSAGQSRVLVALLDREDVDGDTYRAVILTAGEISSNGEKTRVLLAAADRVRGNPELLAVYEEVARTLASREERRRALAAMTAPNR